MIKFIKMHGTGNNYVYLDLINNEIKCDDFSLLSKKISNVNFGVGSDGLILICNSNIADAKMIMYNKDGSEGKMCGNGIRCVAKYVYENVCKKKDLLIETKSGIKKVKIVTSGNEVTSVIVNMGKPILDTKKIPVLLNFDKVINKEHNFNGNNIKINCVSMGNPHTILFVDNVDKVNVEKLGNLIQNDKLFPNKCNVEFVQIISKNKIKMRVWEIGSGETYSCGTGACASVVAGTLNGYLNKKEKIEVEVLGGKLNIIYDDELYMEGPCDVICIGYYNNY